MRFRRSKPCASCEYVTGSPSSIHPLSEFAQGSHLYSGCNRFHERKRTVRTLSYDQVNRPLYATSVNRWQHYEKFLKGVDWPAYETNR